MTSRLAAVLFDIDGTLVRAGGAGRRAVVAALEGAWGRVDGRVHEMRFDGMTDRRIVREALAFGGVPFSEAACDAVLARYVEALERELVEAPGFKVLPGAAATLEALAARATPFGLCTGNVAAGARLKLRRGALDGHFDWSPAGLHGFGDDGEARELLVAAAVARVSAGLGREVRPAEVLIVGDTPRDVAAARAVGCAVLCVATGNFDAAALAATGPDAVAATLEDEVARRLLGLAP